MRLQHCTITGADDRVNPAELAEISKKYPFMEWGIPLHPDQRGTPRYPTAAWVERFHEICPNIHKSTHLCYKGLTGFVAGAPDVMQHIARFPRVQLNFSPDFDMKEINPAALARRVASQPDRQFILQYNTRTQSLLPLFDEVPNLAILFDGSLGQGHRTDKWPKPLDGRHCGYAGGIGPKTIHDDLDRISALLAPGQKTWVDMETRVRTENDELDLDKVLSVAETVKRYTARPHRVGPPVHLQSKEL